MNTSECYDISIAGTARHQQEGETTHTDKVSTTEDVECDFGDLQPGVKVDLLPHGKFICYARETMVRCINLCTFPTNHLSDITVFNNTSACKWPCMCMSTRAFMYCYARQRYV